jgi:phosphoglucosamine mutase
MAPLLQGVVLFPQTLINVRLDGASDWRGNARLSREQEAVTRELGEEGRILIRPSGTEPVLRVMVEARTEDLARRCAERLADAARA